ncbi:hypothetical protein BGZ65_010768 [Modicella reniformis]|uniref:Secreted protein n=1 Tax=Modicella reniformis TaxID=1440133 RepID=A0A9P6J3R8_9FUNG|nr:hypothetical protein BGZ65_010768 [Modicella reniformis]
MVWNSALFLIIAAAAAPVFAEEPSNCKIPDVRYNVTTIQDADNFCTMFPPKGVGLVAPSEACATSVCFGNPTSAGDAIKDNEKFASGVILSAHFLKNEAAKYVQITGCMNGALWNLNGTDDGGQMDSHGWEYRCAGYGKFLSLVEPSSNSYCIRCCAGAKDPNCNTGKSTMGCWNLIPGDYSMPDGSNCPAPTTPTLPGGVVPTTPGTSPTPGTTDPNGGSSTAPAVPSNSSSPSNGADKPSAGVRSVVSLEVVGMFAAGAIALAAF